MSQNRRNVLLLFLLKTISTTEQNEKNRERVERTLRAEELAGDVEGLTSHNDDLLAVEQLLGDSAGQATKEVSFAVDDDLYSRNTQSAVTVISGVPTPKLKMLKI